ncbi:AT-rich interactive domain-containing protein 5A [Tamandua tetradactyla]|uniref:AT-rich interactive domain-containing protein 5A n=1 Tax=Tamandua tetradactyla TaxID=48850 RepID=UPI0040540929
MAPPASGKRKQSEESDPLQPAVSPTADGELSRTQSPVLLEGVPAAGGEQEEEQAFLVSLYKFMKERHTPIERVPHLGFKQINLWKIHKAVEKLGAYELVTGRRLWKSVYDELGGSPGSTSAATCTRRHYERLVLPYVRHLKGEDDKPLPPSKPRKQHRMVKEPREDDGAAERPSRAREEQVTPARPRVDAADPAQPPSREPPRTSNEQPGAAPGPALPLAGASNCPGAYQRLLSSFYGKGAHGVMSPLAKKKLLAQASQAEASPCPEDGCCRGTGGSPRACSSEGARNPGLAKTCRSPRSPPEVPQPPGGSLREEARAGPCPPAPIFASCFHAHPGEVLRPVTRHPRDFLPSLRDRAPGREEGLPAREPPQVWGGGASRPSAFHRGSPYPKPKACWVAPMAQGSADGPAAPPGCPSGSGLGKRGAEEEEGEAGKEGCVRGGKKPRVVSPSLQERVKPVGPGLAASCLLGPTLAPTPHEAYRGAMLRCPLSFAHAPAPLKGPAMLPLGPLVIPAFPAHVLAAAGPSPMAAGLMHFPPAAFDSALRHRLGPASATWHVPPATMYAASPFFHLNTRL